MAPQRASDMASSTNIPPSVHDVLNEPGHPLDAGIRAFMEPRFDQDFSAVRVHTGERAARSTRTVDALAYTVGHDVVFGSGQYAPATPAGRHLMAHELAHVVQQQAGLASGLQRQATSNGSTVEEEKAAEAAAASVAETATASLPGTVTSSAAETEVRPAPDNDAEPMKEDGPKKIAACDRKILAEGTCANLVAGSKYLCCDPDNGIERKGKTKDIDGTACPSQKFTPIFTCDKTGAKALERSCKDDDNWMAVPGDQFKWSMCSTVYTICANGKQTTGYVRDKSETSSRYEVSPGIQKALGVTVGSSFMGAIYRPGVKAATINKDPCCHS